MFVIQTDNHGLLEVRPPGGECSSASTNVAAGRMRPRGRTRREIIALGRVARVSRPRRRSHRCDGGELQRLAEQLPPPTFDADRRLQRWMRGTRLKPLLDRSRSRWSNPHAPTRLKPWSLSMSDDLSRRAFVAAARYRRRHARHSPGPRRQRAVSASRSSAAAAVGSGHLKAARRPGGGGQRRRRRRLRRLSAADRTGQRKPAEPKATATTKILDREDVDAV